MNFKKLLSIQKELDDRIIKEKELDWSPEERLVNTVVALDVELSEVANCAEWFKFWKINKGKADEGKTHRETLLEEVVDALHFYLSIANQVNEFHPFEFKLEQISASKVTVITESSPNALYMVSKKAMLEVIAPLSGSGKAVNDSFRFFMYVVLHHLKFTTEELEAAYYEKNKINHERQDNKY